LFEQAAGLGDADGEIGNIVIGHADPDFVGSVKIGGEYHGEYSDEKRSHPHQTPPLGVA
jgi:hypothetical protein